MSNSAKFIGLGLPRTGTQSLAAALKELQIITAIREAYFMPVEDVYDLLHKVEGPAYIGGIIVQPSWQLLLDDPDIRFINTTRPVEDWLHSIQWLHRTDRPAMRTKLCARMFGTDQWDQGTYVRAFRAHHWRIQKAIPPDRLLTIRICEGEGWPELCGFTGAEVPDVPFPHRDGWKRQVPKECFPNYVIQPVSESD